MDALTKTQRLPPLKDIIHLVFMFHETNAYAMRGSVDQTRLLRDEEETLYECHSVSRETVHDYAANYDRAAVLEFFRNDPTYVELEKAFARAPNAKNAIIKRLTSFCPESRVEAKHLRTIPTAEYPRAIAQLNALPREHRHGQF
jgi:hypothetical protein